MVPRRILPVVVAGQLLALGIWFSGTAVLPEARVAWHLSDDQAALVTILVQVGFVVGTLLSALTNLADRYPAHRVLFASALVGAAANALLLLGPPWALPMRFLTGVALAGVYPVGMKLLATWYERLGLALGLLLAALTLGSGSPYLVRALGLPWPTVVLAASALAVVGGALVLVGAHPGPRLPARASTFDTRAFARAFRVPEFRASALAYFGHMWELYAFWGLVPLFLLARGDLSALAVAALTFGAFLAGAAACVLGGVVSQRVGEAAVARTAMVISAACCLASPLAFILPLSALPFFLLVWGASVIADSPQFSAMSARAAPREFVGTALTMQNAIGFAITFGSLALVPRLADAFGWKWAFLVLAPGPILGVTALRRIDHQGARTGIEGNEAHEAK